MRVVTFKVEEELLERLDRYARSRGKTRSEIIREAVQVYLIMEDRKEARRAKRIEIYY